MPTTSLTKTQFEHELDALARLQEKVVAVLRPAVEAFLNFANEYRTLYTRVGADRQRRDALQERLGIDAYQHQRFMAIAESSTTLSTFKRALPPAVEPLYEVARLTRDSHGEQRLRTAVKRHELTTTSGIREIRGIRNSLRGKPTKSVPVAAESRRLTTFDFVFESDAVLRWHEVEEFNRALAALLTPHKLRSVSLRNEKALQKRIESYWTQKDGADKLKTLRDLIEVRSPRKNGAKREKQAEPTPEEIKKARGAPGSHDELDWLQAAYNTLLSQNWERIRTRAEKGIKRLVQAGYRRLLRQAHKGLRGAPFRNIRARTREAEKRTLYPDEVYGGVLGLDEVMGINNRNDVMRFIEAANTKAEMSTDLGADDVSILVRAQTVGILGSLDDLTGADRVVRCIREARNSVKESAALRKAADALERADAAYKKAHAEEIAADEKADEARLREMANRSLGSRRRRRGLLKSN